MFLPPPPDRPACHPPPMSWRPSGGAGRSQGRGRRLRAAAFAPNTRLLAATPAAAAEGQLCPAGSSREGGVEVCLHWTSASRPGPAGSQPHQTSTSQSTGANGAGRTRRHSGTKHAGIRGPIFQDQRTNIPGPIDQHAGSNRPTRRVQ